MIQQIECGGQELRHRDNGYVDRTNVPGRMIRDRVKRTITSAAVPAHSSSKEDSDQPGVTDDESDVPVRHDQQQSDRPVPVELTKAVHSLMQDRHLRMMRFDPRPEVRIPTVISMCKQLMRHPVAIVRESAGTWYGFWTIRYPEFVRENRLTTSK